MWSNTQKWKDFNGHICTFLFQGGREALKNAIKWAKQAFRRLEARVLRPDKEKIQLEPGVRGQEGEGGERGKWNQKRM